ncbi:MAG TPA: SdrD B-like domain-containing protein [Pirellulales bacterium]|nr:SdrD B-like domain-containing protein [Pirellulales bacterium]
MSPSFPIVQFDSTGVVDYNASTNVFSMTGSPLSFKSSASSPIQPITSPRNVSIQIDVDNSGKLINDGQLVDFTVTGNIPANPSLSGTLLTGKIIEFGYANTGGGNSAFDFVAIPLGGTLFSMYAGQDVGITEASESTTNSVPFTDFTTNFHTGAKGTIGTIPLATGNIAGTKYTDITGDGFSSDDTPLGGVTVNLYYDLDQSGTLTAGDGPAIATTTTAGDGTYSFNNLLPGTYFVQESVPSGYTQTGGGTYTVNVTAGSTSTGNNFDDFQNINISGTKFTDLTGNGFSSDDTGLGGVTINLYKNGGSSPVASTMTASNGTYSFTNLGPGSYSVQEVVPAGYTQTGGNAGYSISATSGTNSTGNNFDDFQNINISGTKFTDLTGNGFSSDDTGLGGVTIDLFLNGGSTPVASTMTASNGTYSFTNLGPGTYSVQEVVPAGWTQTGGVGGYSISATSGGNCTGKNFDDFQNISISGTKYKDITGNGFSSDDTVLGGVTINLYKNGGSSPVASTVTASNGTYSFTNLGPGTYSVQEVVPAGYTQTGGVGGYSISATSGASYTGKNFDNAPNNITISGTKYNDLTGNGCSSDDPGLGGVTIKLYKDANNDGVLTSADGSAVATTTTASNGTYSFSNLAPGTYFVQEVVPSGYIQTDGGPNGSAGNTYYTVVVHCSQSYTGYDFDDFLIPTCTPKCYSFSVTNSSCSKTVSDLRGNTDQGDTVTVTFTTGNMADTLTLVSYIAPGPAFDSTTAYQQQIFDEATGTFAANGTYTLTVLIPNCDYQIDFVCGSAINELGPPTDCNGNPYGPDSSNIFYSAQSRLLSADNDGTGTLKTKTVASGDFGTTALWSSTNGQNLIKKFDSGANSTDLAQWLATSFPNLYGAGAGSHSLVNSNGTYFTTTQVAAAYSKFSGGDQQVFSAALSVYATSIGLEGSTGASYAKSTVGLTTSLYGSAMDTVNVGSNGAAFGVANNTTLTVMQLLSYLNANTNAGSSVSSGASSIFSSINATGNVKNATLDNSGLAYTPAQIRAAYGISKLSLDGSGQTIAIVDAYDDPNIVQAVDTFDTQFGTTSSGPSLYDQYGPATSFLTVVGQDGDPSSLPGADPSGSGISNWEMEETLDVEWAHAVAPGAQIILVEANSASVDDLMSSVKTAANLPGVSVVSMSWGFVEGLSVVAQDEAMYDSYLTTPAGHQGVTFVASTGDYGAAIPQYPSFSPNVVAVGGTSLQINSDNSYSNESGWGAYASDGSGTFLGSGGGVSQFENEPTFQDGVQTTGFRTTPDVSFVADPSTGVWIADTYNLPSDNPWAIVGGTSLSAPAWAALVALADQGRVSAGKDTLGSAGSSEAQTALYSASQSDYNNIASGNNGYSAQAGYNLVTGLGTPVANLLVTDLVAYNGAPMSSSAAGQQMMSGSGLVYASTFDGGSLAGSEGLANAVAVFNSELAGTSMSGLGEFSGMQPELATAVPSNSSRATGSAIFPVIEPNSSSISMTDVVRDATLGPAYSSFSGDYMSGFGTLSSGRDDAFATGTDLSFAGRTALEGNSAALQAIFADWNSTGDFAPGMQSIFEGADSVTLQSDNYSVSDDTLFDDQAVDYLNGSSDQDWTLARVNAGAVDSVVADDSVADHSSATAASPKA